MFRKVCFDLTAGAVEGEEGFLCHGTGGGGFPVKQVHADRGGVDAALVRANDPDDRVQSVHTRALVVDKDAVKDQAAARLQFVGDKGINTVDVTVVEAQVARPFAVRTEQLVGQILFRNGARLPGSPAQTGATGADDAEV